MTVYLKDDKSWENEIQEDGFDETDDVNSNFVACLGIGCPIFSIILHFIDVFLDIYLAYTYYKSGEYGYFGWTVAFVLVPTVIMTLISIKMYIDDNKKKSSGWYAIIRIVLCILGMIVQIPPVIRYFDSLRYSIKSSIAKSQGDKKEQKKNYIKMIYEDSDVALLRVFECYLESAPQLVLQITLLVTDFINGSKIHTAKQFLSITSSFVGMGACMATYHRVLKLESNFDEDNRKKISKLGLVVQFFWHLNFTVSRVMALSAVAVLYPLWTGIAVVIHWAVMAVWLGMRSYTKFCGNHSVLELFFTSAVALIYIFNFISLKEGSTRYLYLFFYLLCFVENLTAATAWGLKGNLYVQNWVYYIFLIPPIVNFILGVFLSVIYYTYLHPNKKKSGVKNDCNALFQ